MTAADGSDSCRVRGQRPGQRTDVATAAWPPPGRPMTRNRHLSRRQRKPSQPQRHQDTKKNTKESLRAHLGILVVQLWSGCRRRAGVSATRGPEEDCNGAPIRALPLAPAPAAAFGRCRCRGTWPRFPIGPAPPRGLAGGREIRNSKFEIRNRHGHLTDFRMSRTSNIPPAPLLLRPSAPPPLCRPAGGVVGYSCIRFSRCSEGTSHSVGSPSPRAAILCATVSRM